MRTTPSGKRLGIFMAFLRREPRPVATSLGGRTLAGHLVSTPHHRFQTVLDVARRHGLDREGMLALADGAPRTRFTSHGLAAIEAARADLLAALKTEAVDVFALPAAAYEWQRVQAYGEAGHGFLAVVHDRRLDLAPDAGSFAHRLPVGTAVAVLMSQSAGHRSLKTYVGTVASAAKPGVVAVSSGGRVVPLPVPHILALALPNATKQTL